MTGPGGPGEPVTGPGLRHHGDADVGPGLLDFAVNVRSSVPPPWLRERLVAAIDRLGPYPTAADDLRARAAVAHRHGRRPEEVLVLAGSTEAFTLLASLRPRRPVVVHPGFTEAEAALTAAGLPVTRVVTRESDGHRFDAASVPDDADLVVVGNPTNPTGVLHPAAQLTRLLRPERVVLVDEAFADAIPREPDSLAGCRHGGLLVLRSLTKTWALAGLRAGYVLGSPDLLARLAAARPHWPVGTLVLEAVAACSHPDAVAEARRDAVRLAFDRCMQVAALRRVPDVHVLPGRAPFVLLRLPPGTGARVREGLRSAGVAVRRCDSFPGLGPDHLRVAVRPAAQVAVLVAALDGLLAAARADAR